MTSYFGSFSLLGGVSSGGLPGYVAGRYYGAPFDSVNAQSANAIGKTFSQLTPFISRGGSFDALRVDLISGAVGVQIKIFEMSAQSDTLGAKVFETASIAAGNNTIVLMSAPLTLPPGDYLVAIGLRSDATTTSANITGYDSDSGSNASYAGWSYAANFGGVPSVNQHLSSFYRADVPIDLLEVGDSLVGQSRASAPIILMRAA
jgi:hypothetical protein